MLLLLKLSPIFVLGLVRQGNYFHSAREAAKKFFLLNGRTFKRGGGKGSVFNDFFFFYYLKKSSYGVKGTAMIFFSASPILL